MLRRLVLVALLISATGVPVAVADSSDPVATVLSPTQPGRATLLVLLPATGGTAEHHLAAARAAQQSAGGRLWVAIPAVGASPADAAARYELLVDRVREQAELRDGDVVVAGWGDAARAAEAIAEKHPVAAVAALGTGDVLQPTTLRVLGELDRGTRVVATALQGGRVTVLPAVDDVRSAAAGEVLGELVRATRGDTAGLEERLATDRVVAAVRSAADLERGQVCADLQHLTADLPAADTGRLTVANRASTDLMAPTPNGLVAGDLGGFLYDKAQLVDDGDTARATTNSYVPAGRPAVEVMCKTKSRSAVAQAVLGSHELVDATAPSCADFTRSTLDWAAAQVSPEASARSGGVTVLPDAMKSAGPEWVFSPMLLRPADPVTGRWEVQSPALVTQLTDTDLDPEFAGNHYCKVLSPLRALELVLDDTTGAAHSTS